MRIAILALGTRGDVELFVSLGRELQARGHQVVLGSSGFFESPVLAAGLEWQKVGSGSFDQLRTTLAALSESDDGETRTRRYVSDWLQPQLRQGANALRSMTARADYFISNLKLVMARDGVVIPGAAVTYDPPASPDDLARSGTRNHGDRVIDLVAMDRRLIDPDETWDERYRFTGFWSSNPGPTRPRDARLQSWLERGDAPVVVTLGSMTSFDSDRLVACVREAIRLQGVRCVLVRGWSSITTSDQEDATTLMIGEASYEQLFPAARCVVHHGGYGTLVSVLTAGVPSILLPQIRAQQEFGKRLLAEKLATGMFDISQLDPRSLAAALQRADTDVEIQAQVRRWQARIATQAGLATAAEAVEAHGGAIAGR